MFIALLFCLAVAGPVATQNPGVSAPRHRDKQSMTVFRVNGKPIARCFMPRAEINFMGSFIISNTIPFSPVRVDNKCLDSLNCTA
jgi:hypothetical protein